MFTQPQPGEQIPEGNPVEVLVAAVDDADVDAIDLYLDGLLLRRENTTPWTWDPQRGDPALDNLSPGTYELTATATTYSGVTYSASSIFEITPAAFRVSGISLIHAGDSSVYPSFDPIDDGELVSIDIDIVGSPELSLLANYEGEVGSVRFSLDDNESFHIDDSTPFTFTSNSDAWNLTPGEHDITATPFSESNAVGIRGPGVTVQIRVEQAILAVDRTTLSLYSSLDSSEGAQTTLSISNTGNVSGTFSIENIPDWLNISIQSGTVDAGETVNLILTADLCTQISSETNELVINPASIQNNINLSLSWSCDNRPEFDFVLERFYFNQAVPANDSLEGSDGQNIEVITGRPGLARAFVSRNNNDVNTLPEVVLNYRTADGQSGSYVLEYPNSVPLAIDEGNENASFNILLPAEFFQLGTEFYIEVDPNNVVSEFFEDNNRYPSSGYLALNIIDPAIMEIVFVPVIVGDSGTDPQLNDDRILELMNRSEAMLPLEDYSFSIRSQSFTYTGDSWSEAVGLINNIRLSEDRNKFYHGLLASDIGSSNTAGIAFLNAKAALSRTFSSTIAHEFGHNLSLSHTDCGGPDGPEPLYPYENARTGNWGYDIMNDQLKSPDLADFMSYCRPNWIGSFNFKKMIDYRGGQRPQALSTNTQIANAQVSNINVPYATRISEPTILSGKINGDTAEIDYVFNIKGDVEISFSQRFRIELINKSGSTLYEAGFMPLHVDHENSLQFEIALPREVLTNETSEIRIFRDNILLLQESWLSSATASISKPNISPNIKRLDENRVEINWPANGKKALWVSDNITRNILAIDKSGHVIVHTSNNQLELKYLEQGRQDITVVEISN